MQKEATAKAQETILEKQRGDDTNFFAGSNSGNLKLKSYIIVRQDTKRLLIILR